MSNTTTNNEIILLDSDSNQENNEEEEEEEYSEPPVKKHKPLAITPFNGGSSGSSSPSSSSGEVSDARIPPTVSTRVHAHGSSLHYSIQQSDQDEEDEGDVEDEAQPEISYTHTHYQKQISNEDVSEQNNDDDDDDVVEVLSLPSSLAPPASTLVVSSEEEHNEEDDSDLDSVSFDEVGSVSPDLVAETRKYLKQHGTLKFLEKYLPTAASSEDILRLILKLGFFPRDIPSSALNNDNDEENNENLMALIRILNRAMMKVKSIRNRLDNVKDINDVLRLLKTSKKILVITGAGISTSLGIPDFRSSQGFYNQLQHLGLSDPQEVFDLELFHTDPSLFYSIAYMILPPEKIYSPLHGFIKVLQSKGKLLRNYTQNIDNLESYAGISSSKLIQCHGSFATATCVTCNYQVKGETIFEQIRNKDIAYCPKCTKTRNQLLRDDEDVYISESFGVFKPDITFFGEPLPRAFHDSINQDLADCDLLISIGTSLKVAPVADIVDKVPPQVPQILINKDPINHCNFDVSLLGYCDDVASYLSNELGPTWDIDHEKYNKIRGVDPLGSNLEVNLIDEEYREYELINKETKAREELEQKEREEIVEVGVLDIGPQNDDDEEEEEEEEDDDDEEQQQQQESSKRESILLEGEEELESESESDILPNERVNVIVSEFSEVIELDESDNSKSIVDDD
ncbi:DHS-like NAD/FAD-binding domain-containing protein [Scheffersomyces amazonensis]|uniref:DHS-like NAD/FAD-binding domain-containing protein n=1 Tax=Scheffersomyces amazonensis TaxID=1078765 RepID=UPI00315DCAC3